MFEWIAIVQFSQFYKAGAIQNEIKISQNHLDIQNYEDAVKNVDTLDYIIILENYNSEIKILNEKLNKYFNVNHNFEYIHMNENKINYKEYMNETIINKVKNYIMDDIKLYNYILSKK